MQDLFFYVQLGWEHIISLDALDHQLFILALISIYTFNDWKKILFLVTAFTIGHSITLAISSMDLFRISTKWVEVLIPVTIFLLAVENLFFKKIQKYSPKINYALILFFGLIHGLGFANTARMLITEEEYIAVPILGFNIGLELGQIVVVLLLLLLSTILINFLKLPQKIWIYGTSIITIILSLKMILERI